MSARKLNACAWGVIVLFVALVAILGWQATKFKIDASADTLLMKDNKNYLRTQLASQRYDPAEFILVAFKPTSGNIFAQETLRTVADISEELEAIDRVTRVRSLINVPIFTELDNITGIEPDQLTWQAQQYDSQTLENALTEHPLYEGLLLNEDQTALSMQVVFAANPELQRIQNDIIAIKKHLLERELSEQEQSQLDQLQEEKTQLQQQLEQTRAEEIESIRSLLKPYQDQGEFFLGGNNLLAYQLINIIKNDLILFGSAIAVLVTLVLFFLFRSATWVIMPLLCCAVSVISTLGLLGLLGLKVTVISANVIALQIILTLAVIIHLIVQYQELQQNGKSEHNQLVLDTVREKFKPCFFAGLTTSIGFASLIFSGVQPVISFGWMMVMAIAVTLFVSLLLFPACMIAWRNTHQKLVQHRFIERFMSACAAACLHRQGVIIGTSLLLLALGLVGCFRLTAENSFLNYFSESTDVYRELSFIDKNFGGSTPFDVLYNIPENKREQDLVVTAEAVQQVEDIQNALAQEEAIGNITSIADFTRIAKVVTGKPLTEYELTALYRSLDDALRADLFGSYFNEQNDQVRISTRIQDTTEGLDRGALVERIHEKLESIGLSPTDYQLTNLFILYQNILDRLVQSQFTTLGIVYLAMFVVLLGVFRSIKIALICLAPNVITTAAILGTLGLAQIPLDLMTITIAAIAMGISVDDTIHYVHRYQRETGNRASEPLQRTHLTVGYALVYTTAVIVMGFSCLLFSEFVPSVLFGLLTGIAMLVALATDITLLPVLLKRYASAPSSKEPTESGQNRATEV